MKKLALLVREVGCSHNVKISSIPGLLAPDPLSEEEEIRVSRVFAASSRAYRANLLAIARLLEWMKGKRSVPGAVELAVRTLVNFEELGL